MKGTRRTPESKSRAVNIALASASLLSLSAVPAIVHADGSVDGNSSTSGVYVTILSPNPGTDLTGKKQVEISAYYESSYGVSSLDLYIDGQRMATQHLTSAEARGEISFVVDPASLQPGSHAIVVRATATDEEVASARTVLNLPTVTTSVAPSVPVVTNDTSDTTDNSTVSQPDVAGAPTIQVVSPAPSDSVQGLVQIKVNAVDASGKPPYVSLFIDRSFKTLRNFAPYTFDWDTTKLPNGPHTIEVFGYNDAQQVGHAEPVRVNVNNPSGHTFERHDLSDFAPTTATPKAKLDILTTSHTSIAPKTKVARARATRSAGEPSLAFDYLNSVVPHLVADNQKMAKLDLNDSMLGAETLPSSSMSDLSAPSLSDIAAANREAAHTTKTSVTRAASVVRRASAKSVPHLRTEPALAADRTTLSGLRSKDQLDSLSAEPLDTTLASGDVSSDNGFAPNLSNSVVVTRKASAKSIPSLVTKPASHRAQIASATVGADTLSMPELSPSQTPKIDLNEIERQASELVPTLKPIDIKAINTRDMHRLRGSFEVVVDNERVSLQEPLQERGALLYAPMRQIFETQGGELSWDQVRHQVRAQTTAGEVVLRIGSHHAIVNNRAVKMQGAAYLLNNRTMLPVDFYATAMNAAVSFDPINGHLVIESKD